MASYSEEKSADRRHIGELMRGATLRLWNLQVKPKYHIKDPSKFWPMPWDEHQSSLEETARQIKSMSKEDRDKMAQEFIKRIGDGN